MEVEDSSCRELGEPRQALAAVIAGDEGGLRRLAELLGAVPAREGGGGGAGSVVEHARSGRYAGTTADALHKAMAAREVHFEQDCRAARRGSSARTSTRGAAASGGVEAEACGMSTLTPPRPWPLDKNGKPKRRVAVPGNGRVLAPGRHARGRLPRRGRAVAMAWSVRDDHCGARARGEASARRAAASASQPNPRLKFGEAADRWLAEQVSQLRPSTQANYRATSKPPAPALGQPPDGRDRRHRRRAPRARAARRRLAEWTIAGICRAAPACSSSRAGTATGVARTRSRSWRRASGRGQRDAGAAHLRRRRAGADARRVDEPWTTLFRLASVVGGRESELLGLWWQNLDLSDLGAATIRSRTRSTATAGACR